MIEYQLAWAEGGHIPSRKQVRVVMVIVLHTIVADCVRRLYRCGDVHMNPGKGAYFLDAPVFQVGVTVSNTCIACLIVCTGLHSVPESF